MAELAPGAVVFGNPQQRIDGRAKVTGQARYPSDEAVLNPAYAFLLTSFIAKGRTVIIIAHRLSAVRDASRIFVMERGELVESGTHAELLNRSGGRYARLLAMQAG